MTPVALIWDLDGTLLDSYPAIVPSAREVCAAIGADYSDDYIHTYVIRTSVGQLLRELAAERALDPLPLIERFNRLSDSRLALVRAMPHARETLAALCEKGAQNFVYTHRGDSSFPILENTGLAPYLTEVLTSRSGFPRKPEPDALLYLLRKYALDPAHTWYVGDRSLDIEAARRAGLRSILYLDPAAPGEPTGQEDYIVRDLLEIAGLEL